MKTEKIQEYLQSYLDSVIKPRVDKTRNEMGMGPITFTVNQIVKGSYQPPIYHIFLDTEPEIKKSRNLKPHASFMLQGVQKDIQDFFKMFSMNFPTKVHWNKRPIFKNDTIYTED
jgi:hypothetical protein